MLRVIDKMSTLHNYYCLQHLDPDSKVYLGLTNSSVTVNTGHDYHDIQCPTANQKTQTCLRFYPVKDSLRNRLP